MTLAVVTADTAVLPTQLLPLAKTHMRIDWSGEDDFIKSVVARAIGRFQQINDVTLNPTTVKWTPAAADFAMNGSGGAASLPIRPCSGFQASAGDPPADVTADYALALKWDGLYGVPIQVLEGAAADGLTFTLTAGFATAADLPAPVLDVVLRHTAHLYEHREILIPGREYVAPDLALDATWWMPRV